MFWIVMCASGAHALICDLRRRREKGCTIVGRSAPCFVISSCSVFLVFGGGGHAGVRFALFEGPSAFPFVDAHSLFQVSIIGKSLPFRLLAIFEETHGTQLSYKILPSLVVRPPALSYRVPLAGCLCHDCVDVTPYQFPSGSLWTAPFSRYINYTSRITAHSIIVSVENKEHPVAKAAVCATC